MYRTYLLAVIVELQYNWKYALVYAKRGELFSAIKSILKMSYDFIVGVFVTLIGVPIITLCRRVTHEDHSNIPEVKNYIKSLRTVIDYLNYELSR